MSELKYKQHRWSYFMQFWQNLNGAQASQYCVTVNKMCVCVCWVRWVVSTHDQLNNTEPHWYFKKEINFAIDGGSSVPICV